MNVVLRFDPDGQLVAKWREAFQRHGQLMGEFTHGEEYVKELRRHTMVSRLRMDGQDVLMPLADSVVRVVLGKNINASGIASDGMSGKWQAQAWRGVADGNCFDGSAGQRCPPAGRCGGERSGA